MPPRKARIKDIAKLAGVSIGTVDRVLHDRGEVAEKTKERIQSILRETSYSPNVMAQVLKSKKSYHIVSLLPEPTVINSYWQKHPVGMSKAIEELDPFPINLSIVNFDMENEKDFQVNTGKILGMSPDGVLLAPIFKSESIAFCRELSKRKIPFVFIDGYIESADFLAYIGENVYQSGKVAGQLLDMVTEETKDILVVNVAKNIQNVHHLRKRTEGFMSFFDKSCRNKGRKLSINIPEPEPSAVQKAMDDILKNYPDIGAIFISGSKSYLIANYMRERGLTSINLIGYDLLDTNVEFLKQGIIRFLIGQRPEEQTYKGVKKLFEYLSLNKTPENFEYLPVDIVTSENVDFFI
ncbi:MAG TPA: LacI family DNA-binding transcriptional regulator [Bacteroidales bacterium]|nr:LacI family DNA-binding transcriptional regulator [Bacteroidales bacterium]